VKELLDRGETVQMEKLCVQYGCVEVKNFIINGVLADSRLVDGLYGKSLPSEIVDAMGFFSALRTRIALLIMEITKSEV
jgi:hypothetical protein